MKRLIIYMLIGCCAFNFALAQGKVVKGTVKNNTGTPIEGASVIENAVAGNGVKTDINGNFTITLKGKGNQIRVSSVEYLTKDVIASSGVIITMELDPKTLGDVQVIAFGKQKKITSTSAVVSVSGDVIRQNPSASLQNGLVGRLPGFSAQQRSGQPGSDGADFFIRGTSSYNTGGNTPLIIVDDIEFQYSQFQLLDANEVESVTVLKDASSTAVYGIKGANGVVIVTTRRGKTGPARVSLSTEFAAVSPTTLPKYLGSYDAARLFDSAQVNDNRVAAVPNPTFQPRFTQTDLDLYQNGQDPYGHPNVDWGKVLFKDQSLQSNYHVNISGGTERVKYFVSVGYLNQGGILNNFTQGQDYNSNYYQRRFNYRSNLDINITKDLSIKVDLTGSNNEVNVPSVTNSSTNAGNNNPFYEFNSFLSLAPFAYPIKNPDGSWGYSSWQLNPNGQNGYNGNNLIERLTLGGYNRTYNDNMNFATNVNQKLDFITNGLSAKLVAAYTSNYTYGKSLTRQSFPSYIYNPITNTYTVRTNTNTNNTALGDFLTEKMNTGYTPGQTFRELTVQGFLNYDQSFGGKHHVYGLYLYNRDSKWQYISPTGAQAALYQQYNYIPVNFSGQSMRLGYDYKNKYLLQLNAGYNGTDRFVNGKRYGLFPAASVGYNIAEEKFFKKVKLLKFVDELKLRGSYGIVGSDLLPPGSFYSYRNDYTANGAPGGTSNGNRIIQGNFGTGTGTTGNVTTSIQEGTLANDQVTWEKEKQTDFGIDFSFFHKKLSGSVDYFNRDRYDILTNRGTQSTIFGATLPPINLGKVNNKGYELELNYADKIGKDFTFSVRATYAVAVNKRLFIDEPTFQYAYQQSTGRPIGDPLIYKWTGHFYSDAADIAKRPKVSSSLGTAHPGDLEYADINGDGVIDANDRGFFAKPNLANTNYGFSFDLHYKAFSVSALFQGIINGSSLVIGQASQAFIGNITDLHAHAWNPALGDAALYPWLNLSNNALNDPNGITSTYWYRSTNYLRLRTTQISYQLPTAFLSRFKIKEMRVYANGNNLLTWSDFEKFYHVDPEVAAGSTNIPYPTQKAFNLGLTVTF